MDRRAVEEVEWLRKHIGVDKIDVYKRQKLQSGVMIVLFQKRIE